MVRVWFLVNYGLRLGELEFGPFLQFEHQLLILILHIGALEVRVRLQIQRHQPASGKLHRGVCFFFHLGKRFLEAYWLY